MSRAAIRYAKAILEIAVSSERATQAVNNDMNFDCFGTVSKMQN
jgi:hypothetical protein